MNQNFIEQEQHYKPTVRTGPHPKNKKQDTQKLQLSISLKTRNTCCNKKATPRLPAVTSSYQYNSTELKKATKLQQGMKIPPIHKV
jgi:hypothetical protein